MKRLSRLVVERTGYAAAGLLLVAVAPIAPPTPRVGVARALGLGSAAGFALFAALARSWRPPPLGRPDVARVLAAAAPLLAVGAAGEEALWRLGGIRGLEPLIGPAGAFLFSTVAFALAHLGPGGARSARVHLLTGSCFGGVFMLSGRLAAAVAAHAVYNLLVVGACASWPTAPDHAGAGP